MPTRLFRMLIFEQITGRMNKSALLEQPHLIIPLAGVINRVSLEGKMDRSYHRTPKESDEQVYSTGATVIHESALDEGNEDFQKMDHRSLLH